MKAKSRDADQSGESTSKPAETKSLHHVTKGQGSIRSKRRKKNSYLSGVVGRLGLNVGDTSSLALDLLLGDSDQSLGRVDEQEGDKDEGDLETVLDFSNLLCSSRGRGKREFQQGVRCGDQMIAWDWHKA